MDPTRSGVTTQSTMRKFYSARNHPDVVSGDTTAKEIIDRFINSLLPPTRQQRFSMKGDDGEAVIGWLEFEAYYEGLSLAVDSDEDFLQIVKETYGAL